MGSFLEDLKQDVQCSLCNDTFTEPKILRCFHTFCKVCIRRHAEVIEEVNVFECPKCKSETRLPELSSVDDLKPSLMHSRMVKVLEFVESDHDKVCSVSGSHPPASWHCFDCNRSLCDECEKCHSLFTRDHKVVSLVEMKDEDIKLMFSRGTNCADHIDKIVELFCKNCKEIICLECLKRDHEGHSTISLSKHAKSKIALLSVKLEHVKIREQTMEKKFKAVQEVTKKLRESGENEKREIKRKLEETIRELQLKATELIKQIDDDVEKAEEMKVKGQSVLDQTRGAMEYMKTLIEKGTQTDVINVEVSEYADDILEGDELIEKIQHLGKIFDFNEELKKQVNSGLGTFSKIEQTHQKTSSAEVESELEATKKSKLTISTRSKTRKLIYNPTDIIDVTISPEENVEMNKDYGRIDGKMEMAFITKVAGQLTIEVRVNGKHVSNSPLVVNVQPQKLGNTGEFQMKGVRTKSSDFTGIAVNKDNSRIAVADQFADCVHVFNTNEDLLLTYTSLCYPQGISFRNKTDLVIADNDNHRMCIVNTTTGTLVKSFGSQGNGNGQFLYPHGVHVDEDGDIFVCDLCNHRIQVFTRDGVYQYQFGLTPKSLFYPVNVVTRDGLIYVSDYDNHAIHVFEKKHDVPTRIYTIGDGQLSRPLGLAIDNDHHLLVCDHGNNRIQKFTTGGLFVGRTCDGSCDAPKYLAILKDGQLLVTSQMRKVVYVNDTRAVNDEDDESDSDSGKGNNNEKVSADDNNNGQKKQ